ncbi:MAG: WGR domain-containing protein [Chloroflexota bacterium]
MRYDTEKWQAKRWETERRYYVAELRQDLFGGWCIERHWGARYSRQGNSLTISANDYVHALELLEEVAKRRQLRGYAHA